MIKKSGILFLCVVLCISVAVGCGVGNSQTNKPGTEENPSGTASENPSGTESENSGEGVVPGTSTDGEGSGGAQSGENDSWRDSIQGLPEDFICGMDASSVLAEENSGVVYYNFEEQEQDVFQTFAQAGINYIRLRVWNDPYDENGNGYGGGNNDLATAIVLGSRATKYGMKVSIDFHYSDFWADPTRQLAPKAWAEMKTEEKCSALYDYTKESLTKLLDAGVDVGMVQIGNEINYGMAGETRADAILDLLQSGSKAVREVAASYGKDIQIMIHYTRINKKGEIDQLISRLKKAEIDFDVIGFSYYPFWDSTFDNMSRVLQIMQERYGVKVMLAETSYCYTSQDGDGAGNSLKGTTDLVEGYPASVEGQGQMIHDICKTVNDEGGLGIFYWEGAWIPVGAANANNSPIWEKYGSGWASSYASDYDHVAAGAYGGCSWDNQAMFDFKGHPLESLKVWGYMRGIK